MTDVIEFAKHILGIELLPYQEDFLRQMEEGKLVRFTLRSGKRTLNRIWDEYLQFKKLAPNEEIHDD